MASFQAFWLENSEKERIKIIVTFGSYPMRNGKFQKNSKKIKNIKKIPLWLHFNPKQVGKC